MTNLSPTAQAMMDAAFNTDFEPDNLTPEEHNALVLISDHAIAPPLSPAAQDVLDAVFDHWPGGYNHPGKPRCVAAALRAAAGYLFPNDTAKQCYDRLLAIATELEGHQ